MNTLEANLLKLPAFCAAFDPHDETRPVVIRRGVDGCEPFTSKVDPAEFNEVMGVTAAQASAMIHGSRFGWDKPEADPDHPANAGAIVDLATQRERRRGLPAA